jgi:hypothetical protein
MFSNIDPDPVPEPKELTFLAGAEPKELIDAEVFIPND